MQNKPSIARCIYSLMQRAIFIQQFSSVCPSVTLRCCVKTVKLIECRNSFTDISLLFSHNRNSLIRNLEKFTPNRGLKYRRLWKTTFDIITELQSPAKTTQPAASSTNWTSHWL